MGSLLKPPTQTTTTTNTPWAPQGDALKYGYGQLQNTISSKLGTPYYQGPLYATMDPLTGQGIQANSGYATGAGAQAAGAVGSSSQGLLPSGSSAMGAYGQLASMAGQDPTQGNIVSAGAYADNPYLNGQIDAASRDVTRNLYENQLPGLNQAATGSGNINSSRAGVAQGIMMRGAADQIGDIASQMRGSAYQNGLALAEQARQANMSGLGAAGSGYGNVYGLGLEGSGLGQNMALNNGNSLISGGQLYQQDQQGQDNAAFQQWQGQDQRDLGLLGQYMGMVNSGPGFGTSTATGPSGMGSPLQQILGAGVAGLGAYMGAGGTFSDIRLKTNIQKVGKTPSGLNVYTFKYRQDRGLKLPLGTHTGVIAQEVADVRPEALGIKDGYLTVDYGKL